MYKEESHDTWQRKYSGNTNVATEINLQLHRFKQY